VVAGRLEGRVAGRREQRILNGNAQDEAEPKPVRSLASSLGAGKRKSFIFHALDMGPARKSQMRRPPQ
jgi:hypothetical protein